MTKWEEFLAEDFDETRTPELMQKLNVLFQKQVSQLVKRLESFEQTIPIFDPAKIDGSDQ